MSHATACTLTAAVSVTEAPLLIAVPAPQVVPLPLHTGTIASLSVQQIPAAPADVSATAEDEGNASTEPLAIDGVGAPRAV